MDRPGLNQAAANDPSVMMKVRGSLRLVMCQRSQSAVAAHIASIAFLILTSYLRNELTTAMLLFAGVICAASVSRLLTSRAYQGGLKSKGVWAGFVVSLMAQSAGWSLFAIHALDHFSFNHFYTLMVLLVAASIGAGSTSSVGGDLALARSFLSILCGSVILWLVASGGGERMWLAVNISMFLIFNLVQAKLQNSTLISSEYWKIVASDAEARMRGVFDAVPSQILVINHELVYTDENSDADQLLFATNNIRGAKVGSVEASPELSRAIMAAIACLRNGNDLPSETREVSLVSTQGAIKFWHISAAVTDKKSGEFFIITMTDITEIKKTESELRISREKSERLAKSAAVGELASGMAHEVNNPLTIISGHLMVMSREMGGPTRKMELMNQQIRRIAGVVHGFLRYAKMDMTDLSRDMDLQSAVLEGARLVAREIGHFNCQMFVARDKMGLREYIHEESFVSAIAGIIVQMMSDSAHEGANMYVTFSRRSLNVVGGTPKAQTTIRFELSNDSQRAGDWVSLGEHAADAGSDAVSAYHWIGQTIVTDILQRQGAIMIRPEGSNRVVEVRFADDAAAV